MKRFLVLFAFFILCFVSFMWLRWQAEPWVRPMLTKAGVQVIKVEKELWPALHLEGIVFHDVVFDQATVSPAWWQLLMLKPAMSLDVWLDERKQSLTIGQSGDVLFVPEARLNLTLQMLKAYQPMLAMLPMDAYVSLDVDDIRMDAQTWMTQQGQLSLHLYDVSLKLGAAEAIPDVRIEAVFEQGMWNWDLKSDIFAGKGLVKQLVPIQNSVLSGKISFKKANVPTALQMFLPVQKEQIQIQLTGTVAAPVVKWL